MSETSDKGHESPPAGSTAPKSVKFPASLKNMTPIDQDRYMKPLLRSNPNSQGQPAVESTAESSSHSSVSSQQDDVQSDAANKSDGLPKPIIMVTEHQDHRVKKADIGNKHVNVTSEKECDDNQNNTKSGRKY